METVFSEEREVIGWTHWTPLINADGSTDAFYRTNKKKTQVRYLDGTRAEACCNSMDEFNLFLGIRIAYARCKEKALLNKMKEYENKLKKANSEYLDNKNALAKLLNSLD